MLGHAANAIAPARRPLPPAARPRAIVSGAAVRLRPRVLALLTAALLAGALPAVNADQPPPAGPSAALLVPVSHAVLQDGFASARIFTGRVEAKRLSRLGFERAGLLVEVLVREGDTVPAGTVLARLDPAQLAARREELAAALATAEAELALAEATAARFRDSVQDGAVTRQALDEAVEGARAAAARVRLARARIATVDVDLDKSALTAPFDGIVTDRLADEGEVLAAGTPVLALQEQAPPEIRIGVAGPLTHRLTPGETYSLGLGTGQIQARLRTVLPRRTATSRTVDALFDPLLGPVDAAHWPRPGELVRLTLSEDVAEPGLWLPLAALSSGERGLWQALVAVPTDAHAGAGSGAGLGASHRLEPRPVQVLELRDDRAYVSGPIAAGEPVVTGGLQRVVAGQLVRITPTADGTPPDAQVAQGTPDDAQLADRRPGAR